MNHPVDSMSELRQDPISGRWVIIAENRAKRPQGFSSLWQPGGPEGCPFCEGHEEETPREVFAIRSDTSHPDGQGWRVRVVTNKYPALRLPDSLAENSATSFSQMAASFSQTIDERIDGPQPGIGAHEVVIESPEHYIRTTEMSDAHVGDIFRAYHQRMGQHATDDRLKYGVVFKNLGPAAGATIDHAHSQIMALPFVPQQVQEELRGARRYYETDGVCAYDDMLARELASGERIVLETERFVAMCPFASQTPYETWIVPREHASHFEQTDADSLKELGQVTREVLRRIDLVLDRPDTNYLIRSAPFDTPNLSHYHWYVEVVPRVTKIAGFEWATGCTINLVAPETAAKKLASV